MLDVTVVFLDESHASTAIGPLEVFRSAGTLWNALVDRAAEPRFRVRSASIGGRPVQPEGGYRLVPDGALEDVDATDLVFVSSAGLDLDGFLARGAPVVAFLRRMREGGARVAGVCSGVALLAAAGLLDGRRATTHWALVERYRERFPDVVWCPDDLVTESDGLYTGGGVHASLDLALYLVEKLAGRALALECSKALLIDMPRACQAGFAVLPLGARHSDAAIHRAEEWIHRHCGEPFRFEALAQELGMSPRNFIRRFKARHRDGARRLPPAAPRVRRAPAARGRARLGAGGRPRRRLRGRRLLPRALPPPHRARARRLPPALRRARGSGVGPPPERVRGRAARPGAPNPASGAARSGMAGIVGCVSLRTGRPRPILPPCAAW